MTNMNTTDGNVFSKPYQEGTLHLINEVDMALRNVGLVQEADNVYNFNHLIIEGRPLCVEAQRFFLNRFWTLQLLYLQTLMATNEEFPNFNTLDERYCLLNDGEFYQWLDIFKKKILPVCIQHRLPLRIE